MRVLVKIDQLTIEQLMLEAATPEGRAEMMQVHERLIEVQRRAQEQIKRIEIVLARTALGCGNA